MGRVAPHVAADEMEVTFWKIGDKPGLTIPPAKLESTPTFFDASINVAFDCDFRRTSRDEDLFTAAPHPSAQQPMMACTRTS